MKYRCMDGYEIEAKDYRELAVKMWQSMFDPNPTLEEWMEGSAKRAKIYNLSEIRTDTVDHHMEDLIKAGFVSPVTDGE
ncbi:MAG: hypothetical protein K2H64_01950 [Desulfovibrio sp.]|nr:hypothetical protein [Desulfovibrio sp.]